MRRPVTVIGDGLDVAVDVRVEMLAALAMVDAAGDDVKEMRDHAGADEELALGVVVDAPRVAEAVGDDLEHVLGRMVAEDPAVDVDAVPFQDVVGERLFVFVEPALTRRLSHFRRRRIALESVQPSIGTPVQAVDDLVPVADAPSRQTHFDIGHVGLVIAVAIRHEQEVGRRADEGAVEADRDGGGKHDALHEHFAAVGHAVVIGVFQDQDAAVPGIREPAVARLVVEVLGHPEPSAIVPAEGHGLLRPAARRPRR